MLSTSQRAPGYRFQYQVPPTPPPASNTRAEKPSPRRRCSMYIPAKPAPTMTASKTVLAVAGRCGREVVSAVMVRVVSLLVVSMAVARGDLAGRHPSILHDLFQFIVFGGLPCGRMCRRSNYA